MGAAVVMSRWAAAWQAAVEHAEKKLHKSLTENFVSEKKALTEKAQKELEVLKRDLETRL